MQVLSFILALLLDVRVHIPNQPSFGSGSARAAYGTPLIRGITASFITAALLSAALWLAVRLTMELL
ncbi:hypothetical protein FFI89_016970 [Bradyrhizobium sp. KBS0727]|uniref:hypothetical protein n=1 Tax=unclassified Bradyrhizobium TaxID=2631580 RepID=UPI00110EB1A4|nr:MULTISPECIES: hypothetical protein [unclassified Bradyrhizobium]QDW38690.1 hypothetical protein FFI71_016965 [Bradyrhizobium sp. KBS0725]QDW45294.1 hypothetical protein FFI89_016970 [Bradyrhizobium sp. KBS0727]